MKVKICGLKTKEQVDVAVVHGVDFLGFVFAESKRQIKAADVKKITTEVPKKVQKVGVFVSPSSQQLEEAIQEAMLDMVQIHGEMPEQKISVPYIRALPVDNLWITTVENEKEADYLLFDAPPKKYIGGNGEVFDWEVFDPKKVKDKKLFIAGGLTIENVQEAKRRFQPYAVDVSSGVETNGEKDLEKIAAFIKKAKEEFYV
ncbi:phosphoribosylanthranilate isomerase [Enterococcus rivorum]|uniref:N-(5'-phosphoribosyl)anthranilate isomerase n=1 Tax=Enterococcus rivorum TaxID=762845 RepID=A0A1E5L0J6_9ENTE|nr:phosphoribosylanthranilate isomerase [Enterococcus rivorum]MBP2098501.1 phosphoribosylanthranilate isomerase [Enterococcus rivorum]OEH83650.1 N-(5'-phosphoribosyl)anthranilate isomerase [Enterococcus rivorum]